MGQQLDKLPFDGLVVVELGARVGTAACGSLLATTGATVIVAEPGDEQVVGKYRNRAAALAGKHSIVIRPNSSADAALLRHALAAADVIITSSDVPAVVSVSSADYPDAIVCDVTALAEARDGADMLDDKLVQALSGIAAVTGTAEGTATLSDAAVLDLGAGIYGAAAIAAALLVRRRHGGGQHIRSSMYGAAINGLTTFLPFHFDGKVPPRAGNRHPMCAPWNAYKALDGWVLLCSANDEQWKRLCGVMQRPALASEGLLVKLLDRVKNCDAVDAIVQQWMGLRTVAEAVEALNKVGIAAGPIIAVDQLAYNANVKHRDMVRSVRDPENGAMIAIPGPPLAVGKVAAAIPARDADRAFVQALAEKPRVAKVNNDQVRPLAGLRVIEIGQYTTAPLAAKQMAALGAEVIKVEPPEGEASRAWPPLLKGQSYFFALNNANKRSLAVDLRKPDDKAAFADLIRKSDVLVENLKPGSLARLGFSWNALKAINPRLVYCAISGYGQDSIYPGRPAFDTVIQAMCGLMDLTRAEGVPTKIGVSIADTTGGMMGLFCILAMLERREQTGEGCFIDLAMQDVGVWATHTGWRPENRSTHTILLCSDGDVAAIGDADTISSQLRSKDVDPKTHRRSDIVAALLAASIPAAEVRTIDEIGISEGRPGGFIRMVDTGQRRWPLLELPFTLSRMRDYELQPIGELGNANAQFVRKAS